VWKPYDRKTDNDADGDGIRDADDALPLDSTNGSFPVPILSADSDGLPDDVAEGDEILQQFNFSGKNGPFVPGFMQDHGDQFDADRGYGWGRSLIDNHRRRQKAAPLADTYLFTRTHDVWEYVVPNGEYFVELSVGDASYAQVGQNVTVEGESALRNRTTREGRFAEAGVKASVSDGRLTVEIGLEGSTTNTCLNWLRISVPEK